MSLNAPIQSGSSSLVRLTESAVREVKSLLEKESDPSSGTPKFLRLFIEQGGCSGMQYGMVFDERRPEDLESAAGDLAVLIDPISAKYLTGAVVDFSDSLTGGGFKITNPNARESCGCGKSFTA